MTESKNCVPLISPLSKDCNALGAKRNTVTGVGSSLAEKKKMKTILVAAFLWFSLLAFGQTTQLADFDAVTPAKDPDPQVQPPKTRD